MRIYIEIGLTFSENATKNFCICSCVRYCVLHCAMWSIHFQKTWPWPDSGQAALVPAWLVVQNASYILH